MKKQFENIEEVDKYIEQVVKQEHPDEIECVFLGGSFAKDTQTELSDIDYTACVSNKFDHPRFFFQLIGLGGELRLLSIYFFQINEILLSNSDDVGDEEYLWIKGMMPNTRFVAGREDVYRKIVDFYRHLSYSRPPKAKIIHKSFGKLLELIARIKKYHRQNNFVEMVYYGQKLAEHVRRLVIEVNGPISVESENYFLDAHFSLPELPMDFKDLYLAINRYTTDAVTFDEYELSCKNLIVNVVEFLRLNEERLDSLTLDLLNDVDLLRYLEL